MMFGNTSTTTPLFNFGQNGQPSVPTLQQPFSWSSPATTTTPSLQNPNAGTFNFANPTPQPQPAPFSFSPQSQQQLFSFSNPQPLSTFNNFAQPQPTPAQFQNLDQNAMMFHMLQAIQNNQIILQQMIAQIYPNNIQNQPSEALYLSSQLTNGTPIHVQVPSGHASSLALEDLKKLAIGGSRSFAERCCKPKINPDNFSSFLEGCRGSEFRLDNPVISSPSSETLLARSLSRQKARTNLQQEMCHEDRGFRPALKPYYPSYHDHYLTEDEPLRTLWHHKERDSPYHHHHRLPYCSDLTERRGCHNLRMHGKSFDRPRRSMSPERYPSRKCLDEQINRHWKHLTYRYGNGEFGSTTGCRERDKLDSEILKSWRSFDKDKLLMEGNASPHWGNVEPVGFFDCVYDQKFYRPKCTGPPVKSYYYDTYEQPSRGLILTARDVIKARQTSPITVANFPKTFGSFRTKTFNTGNRSTEEKELSKENDTNEEVEELTSPVFLHKKIIE